MEGKLPRGLDALSGSEPMSLWQVLRSLDSVAVYRARIQRSKEAGSNKVRGPVQSTNSGAFL